MFFRGDHPTYRAYDLDYMNTTVLSLDSGYLDGTEGDIHNEWISQVLDQSMGKHVIAFYHNPIFPVCDMVGNANEMSQRELWKKMFLEKGVDVIFENHEHTFKKGTRYAWQDGKAVEDPNGQLLAMGNGAWSVVP